jgi:hypothetical protein
MTPSCIHVAATVQMRRARGRQTPPDHPCCLLCSQRFLPLGPGIHPPLASGSLPPVHHTITWTHGSPSSPRLRRDSCSRPPGCISPPPIELVTRKKKENSRTRFQIQAQAQGPGPRRPEFSPIHHRNWRARNLSAAPRSPALRHSSAVLLVVICPTPSRADARPVPYRQKKNGRPLRPSPAGGRTQTGKVQCLGARGFGAQGYAPPVCRSAAPQPGMAAKQSQPVRRLGFACRPY